MSPWEFARRYAEKPERLVIGLMSGTSVDGVDGVLVRLSGSSRGMRAELVAFDTQPFPSDLRHQIFALCQGKGDARSVSQMNVHLGRLFADVSDAVLGLAGISRHEVDVVASHGQTISHTPTGDCPSTLQIGEPAIIAQRLGVPVVSDFRVADVAVGGQGAPLIPYADWCLLTHPMKARAVQNIGGIGNVTYLPADATPEQVIGFDTGPGNMLIDRAAIWATGELQRFDEDGRIAAQGTVLGDALTYLLADDFLQISPPKSTGREEYGWDRFQSLITERPDLLSFGADLVATFTAFTAHSIADAYERFLPRMPDEVIVGGGGARNPTLMRMLRERLAPIPVLTHEAVGMNGDAKEAVAFALLANETILGNPSNLPSVTGASRPVLLGKITLP